MKRARIGALFAATGHAAGRGKRMIRKSGDRFFEKIMRNQKLKRDGDSIEAHRALGHCAIGRPSPNWRYLRPCFEAA
jgi:hypothetical protein